MRSSIDPECHRPDRQSKVDAAGRQPYVVNMEHAGGPAFVDVHALTRAVEQHVTGSPLDRIEAALSAGNELTAGADELIGHFVDGARKAGCSWTEIGERIGVSKQAARQRFTPLPAVPQGAVPVRQARLAACLDAAGR